MPLIELFENRIQMDEELPMQLSLDARKATETVFSSHWHEDIEIHYIEKGKADFYLNQTCYHGEPGDLLIANSNELHSAVCTEGPYLGQVIIFDVGVLSPELASKHYLLQSIIRNDKMIQSLVARIFEEKRSEQCGYKPLCRALVTELLVYLCRNYVAESLSERDNLKRKKDLERLNVVLSYIHNHYTEQISNTELAKMICLSEDRFGHLFRESVGKAPLQYINDMRLKSAMNLLKTNEYTVTEVAEAVGFQDYNHFGRLFRKRYGCTPYDVKSGKENQKKNSGIV